MATTYVTRQTGVGYVCPTGTKRRAQSFVYQETTQRDITFASKNTRNMRIFMYYRLSEHSEVCETKGETYYTIMYVTRIS